MPKNIGYFQAGGVTAVINATACGVIETAALYRDRIGKVLAGRNGIMGAFTEELIDTSLESVEDIRALRHTPSGAFGSCRFMLGSFEKEPQNYERLFDVFRAHDIGYFLYNGGGGSQDTTYRLSELCQERGYPLVCIGLPKTMDNDLPLTDNSPGFGSVAKYVAVSIREASFDVASMADTSTKVFILEVMGRNAGWVAAAGGLAQKTESDGPHLILFPEIPFRPKEFIARIKKCVKTYGYVSIVAAEGIRDETGKFLSEVAVDAKGFRQLGGVAPVLAQLVKQELGYKYHWAVADYLQRSARHIASRVDVEQAYALGKVAVEYALQGKNGVMLTIERKQANPYQWVVGDVPLKSVADVERMVPREFITEDGYHITPACRAYLEPLIQGEDYPPYQNGLPQYVKLKNQLLQKQLPDFKLNRGE